MPPGILYAVYDSKSGNPDYIPPEYIDIPDLLDELVDYVNTRDDHPFEDGNVIIRTKLEKPSKIKGLALI